MPSEKPLLTIAIPTYNRSACLAQLLRFLSPQLADESRVELIISDNCSPDDTPDVVADLGRLGLAVTSIRNESNIGADANFIQCFDLAKGEYLWIFGDDDIIVPGGLQEVLRELETRTYDLLNIPTQEFRDKYAASLQPGFSRKMKVFHRPEDFALYVSTGLTFISGIIVRKAAIEHLPHDKLKSFIGTNLAQLSWSFYFLRENSTCACFLDRLVASRVENSGGYGACRVFGTNLQAIVKEYFGLESPVGRAILNRTIQSWFPWAVLQSRRGNHSAHLQEDAMNILQCLYRKNPRYWIFVHPMFRLPLPFAKAWMYAVRAVNRMDRLMGYPIAK